MEDFIAVQLWKACNVAASHSIKKFICYSMHQLHKLNVTGKHFSSWLITDLARSTTSELDHVKLQILLPCRAAVVCNEQAFY